VDRPIHIGLSPAAYLAPILKAVQVKWHWHTRAGARMLCVSVEHRRELLSGDPAIGIKAATVASHYAVCIRSNDCASVPRGGGGRDVAEHSPKLDYRFSLHAPEDGGQHGAAEGRAGRKSPSPGAQHEALFGHIADIGVEPAIDWQ